MTERSAGSDVIRGGIAASRRLKLINIRKTQEHRLGKREIAFFYAIIRQAITQANHITSITSGYVNL